MRFESMPRYRYADFPTPLKEMKKFIAVLGGPRLFLTG